MTPLEPDRFEARAREIWSTLVRAEDDPGVDEQDIAVIAAALRAAEASALKRAAEVADAEMEMQHDNGNRFGEETSRRIRDRIRALAPSPESPPAKVNACQVDLRTDKDRECFEDIVQAATRVLRSEPVAPAPSAAEKRIAELGRLLAQARDWLEFMAAHPGDGDAKNLIASIDAALSRTASPGKGEG